MTGPAWSAWRAAVACVVLVIAGARAPDVRAEDGPPGSLLFVKDGDVWVWRGGEASVLFEQGAASDARWSPRGDGVLYVRQADSYSDLVVRWLGDGTESVVTANDPGYDPGSVEYVTASAWIQDPAWSPSGVIAFVSDAYPGDGTMMLRTMAGLEGTPTVAPQAEPEEAIESVSLSSDGTIAAYTVRSYGGGTRVVLRDLSDGQIYPLADDPGGAYDPAFSPDDQHVAVSVREPGATDLWLISRATGDRHRLTAGANAIASAWSPDGRWLAYLSPNEEGFELWALPLDAALTPGEAKHLGDFDNLDATSGLSWSLLA